MWDSVSCTHCIRACFGWCSFVVASVLTASAPYNMHCDSGWGLQDVLASRWCVDWHTHGKLYCCDRSPGMSGLLSKDSWDLNISNRFCILHSQALCCCSAGLYSRLMPTWLTYIIWKSKPRFSLTIVLGSKDGIFNSLHLVPPEFQLQHDAGAHCWGLQDWAPSTWISSI